MSLHTKESFHQMIGECLSLMQTIEYDVKWMYAGMMEGDLKENFQHVLPWTLGASIKALESLDESDALPFLSKEEYSKLRKVNHMRNEIVHHVYLRFLYTKEQYSSLQFEQVDQEISHFHDELVPLSRQMEEKRFAVLKRYKKI